MDEIANGRQCEELSCSTVFTAYIHQVPCSFELISPIEGHAHRCRFPNSVSINKPPPPPPFITRYITNLLIGKPPITPVYVPMLIKAHPYTGTDAHRNPETRKVVATFLHCSAPTSRREGSLSAQSTRYARANLTHVLTQACAHTHTHRNGT